MTQGGDGGAAGGSSCGSAAAAWPYPANFFVVFAIYPCRRALATGHGFESRGGQAPSRQPSALLFGRHPFTPRVAREECQEALLTSHFAQHAPCSSSVRGVACECARDGPRDTHATRAALQKTLSVLSKAKSIIALYPRRFRALSYTRARRRGLVRAWGLPYHRLIVLSTDYRYYCRSHTRSAYSVVTCVHRPPPPIILCGPPLPPPSVANCASACSFATHTCVPQPDAARGSAVASV